MNSNDNQIELSTNADRPYGNINEAVGQAVKQINEPYLTDQAYQQYNRNEEMMSNQQQYPSNNIPYQGNQQYQGNYQYQGYPPNKGMNNQYSPQGPNNMSMVGQNNIGMTTSGGNSRVVLNLPPLITAAHPHYNNLVLHCGTPCQLCSHVGVDIITLEPGCAAYSWAACLYCFTGILCCWIPLISSGCKDIRITCSKCRRIKAVIEKPCC